MTTPPLAPAASHPPAKYRFEFYLPYNYDIPAVYLTRHLRRRQVAFRIYLPGSSRSLATTEQATCVTHPPGNTSLLTKSDYPGTTSRQAVSGAAAPSNPPKCREPSLAPRAGDASVGNRGKDSAYPQQIVTTRLLYCLQDRFAQLSRLQRI